MIFYCPYSSQYN